MTLTDALNRFQKIGSQPYDGTIYSRLRQEIQAAVHSSYPRLTRTDVETLGRFAASLDTQRYAVSELFNVLIPGLLDFPADLFHPAMLVALSDLGGRYSEDATSQSIDSVIAHVGQDKVIRYLLDTLGSVADTATQQRSAKVILFLTGHLDDFAARKMWMSDEILDRLLTCFFTTSDEKLQLIILRDLPPSVGSHRESLLQFAQANHGSVIEAIAHAKLGLADFFVSVPPWTGGIQLPSSAIEVRIFRRHQAGLHLMAPSYGLSASDGRWNETVCHPVNGEQLYVLMRETKKSDVLANTLKNIRNIPVRYSMPAAPRPIV